jgi:hypothetical protein
MLSPAVFHDASGRYVLLELASRLTIRLWVLENMDVGHSHYAASLRSSSTSGTSCSYGPNFSIVEIASSLSLSKYE